MEMKLCEIVKLPEVQNGARIRQITVPAHTFIVTNEPNCLLRFNGWGIPEPIGISNSQKRATDWELVGNKYE